MLIRNEFIQRENCRLGLEDSPIPAYHPESYAQAGEDIIVAATLLADMRLQARDPSTIRYMEVGANRPVETSNTYLLHKTYGASGVLVEANPKLIPLLRSTRPRDTIVHAAVSASRHPTTTLHVGRLSELSSLDPDHVRSFGDYAGRGGIAEEIVVPNIHVNDLFEQHGPSPIDFLSIDVEGLDLTLLSQLDTARFAPAVVQCEPSEHYLAGNGDKMIGEMRRKSYTLIAATPINLIFARRHSASNRTFARLLDDALGWLGRRPRAAASRQAASSR